VHKNWGRRGYHTQPLLLCATHEADIRRLDPSDTPMAADFARGIPILRKCASTVNVWQLWLFRRDFPGIRRMVIVQSDFAQINLRSCAIDKLRHAPGDGRSRANGQSSLQIFEGVKPLQRKGEFLDRAEKIFGCYREVIPQRE
jgi:hypothetical protein